MGQWTPGHVGYRSRDGKPSRLHTGFPFPNGIAITPDGKTLAVAESIGGKLHAFEIRGLGVPGQPREYAALGAEAAPDGYASDSAGFALVAGHGNSKRFAVPPQAGAPVRRLAFEDPGVTHVCFGVRSCERCS